MGLLVIFFVGVFLIIIVARLGSKMRPASERLLDEADKEEQLAELKEELNEDDARETLEALITILTRKEILNPDELLIEIAARRKTKN